MKKIRLRAKKNLKDVGGNLCFKKDKIYTFEVCREGLYKIPADETGMSHSISDGHGGWIEFFAKPRKARK